jgi:LysM repeat protein
MTGRTGLERITTPMGDHARPAMKGSGVESKRRDVSGLIYGLGPRESVTPRRYVGDTPEQGIRAPRRGWVMTSTNNLPGRLLILLITLVAALLLLGGTGAADVPSITGEHRVRAGDTLWTIAEAFTEPGDDVRVSVAMLRDMNDLSSSALDPGQVLLVPIR